MESRKRSWVKSITWRALGIIILGIITWVFTRNWEITTTITGLFHALQLILYYFHERLWDKADWGLKKMNDLSQEEKRRLLERLRKLGYLG